MKRLYHTAKNKPAPLHHKNRVRLLGGYQPEGQINNPAPPPKCRRTDVKARAQHEFAFLPYEGEEDDAMRSVQHAERRKRELAMSMGDRAVLICAALAGVYILMRGVWWALLWMIGQ